MDRVRPSNTLTYLATLVLIVVTLFFGRPILMPLALAILFAFLISPVVNQLARTGLNRTVSLIVVVVLLFSVMGVMTWGVGQQMSSLAFELPKYKDNVRQKIDDLRSAGKGSALERINQTWRELKGELKRNQATNSAPATAQSSDPDPAPDEEEPKPVPVVVRGGAAGGWLPSALGPLVGVLATAGLVIVLVIFLLLRKRELRNRFVLLFGYSRMPTTTRALDEAAEKISRYLLMQTIINGTYGIAVGIALSLLGLPYALLWGGLAALLRFIPYVGPWLGAIMPILLSLAVFPGWFHPFLVLGIILCLELVSNMIMEPMLYGHSVGVSEVALLVAVAFWTWIWGPIGLVLATPLTVCLVVLGKYVPGLGFLHLLLSDEAIMEPSVEYYQRLLAMDKAEAAEVARKFSRHHKLVELYDKLLLPALINAKRDFRNGTLSPEHLQFIVTTTDEIMSKIKVPPSQVAEPEKTDSVPRKKVLAVPIDDATDEVIVRMLSNLLPQGLELQQLFANTLTGEVLALTEQNEPNVVFLGAMAPGGAAEMKYLAKRLRSRFPTVQVVVGRWGLQNPKKLRELSASTGAQAVATDLAGASNLLMQLSRLQNGPFSSAEPAATDLPIRSRVAAVTGVKALAAVEPPDGSD